MNIPTNFGLSDLLQAYRQKRFTPQELLCECALRMEQASDYHIWIQAFSLEQMLNYLDNADPNGVLYGVPFAIKDNIDLAGIPTTAGCEAYAKIPNQSAFVVQQLLDAGAIPVGKTNMDQFATGLVGTRSPYGICKHSYHPDSISGGSSSGSAVAVAMGMCAFSLGTDTAGSGRVPAALNRISGYKPTPGLVSMQGVVPACRSLDTVSFFYRDEEDMDILFPIITTKDSNDAFQNSSIKAGTASQLRIATIDPKSVIWKGNGEGQKRFEELILSYQRRGIQIKCVDCKLFFDVARMLYEGPWVAERYTAVGKFIEQHPDQADPTVSKIIMGGAKITGEQVFSYQYQLMEKKRQVQQFFEHHDALLLPTIGGWFSREDVAADPIGVNSYLGTFTNFANLLHLSACAVPIHFPAFVDEPGFGITLFQTGGEDRSVIHNAHDLAYASTFRSLVVCGAHLDQQPLNVQLTERGGILRQCTNTSPNYRLYALANGKPGLVRSPANQGVSIDVEVWDLPTSEWGSFVDAIPAPLGIGKLELADGQWLSGFIVEPIAVDNATDISHFGSWRKYLQQS